MLCSHVILLLTTIQKLQMLQTECLGIAANE